MTKIKLNLTPKTAPTAAAKKDTVYIDIDDEITAIIDKVQASPHKIVALVLPKRATTLQSIVNMKLLKRSSDEADKHVVLITAEAGLLPLAGAVGLHVAKTPQSKPEIPAAPLAVAAVDATDDEIDYDDEFDPAASSDKPIGALAGDEEEAIELDNDEPDEPTGVAAGAVKVANQVKSKAKKLKVPDFHKFRLGLVLAVLGGILLITGWIFAAVLLPKATITIKTDSEDVAVRLDLALDTSLNEVNAADAKIPAVRKELLKTTTEQVAATSQKDLGAKASGKVTIRFCYDANNDPSIPPAISAGTGISLGNLTYLTQQKGTFEKLTPKLTCGALSRYETTVTITAGAVGTNYNKDNLSGADVAGAAYDTATVLSGSASGGTDSQIVKVVAQSDIDAAKQKLTTDGAAAAVTELSELFRTSDLLAVTETLSNNTAEITTSVNAGDQADTVTVTQKITYHMFGAKQADIAAVITSAVEAQIDKDRQKVLNTGLDDATFGMQTEQNDGALAVVTLDVTALAGPELDAAAIKKDAAGKKGGQVADSLKTNPGVTDVTVEYSPFWVSSIPKSTDKITVVFTK